MKKSPGSAWRRGIRRGLVLGVAGFGFSLLLSACTNPPTGLYTQISSDGTIHLFWTGADPTNSCENVAGYDVYMRTSSGGESTTPISTTQEVDSYGSAVFVTTTDLHFDVKGLPSGTYYFQVTTIGVDNNGLLCIASSSDEAYAALGTLSSPLSVISISPTSGPAAGGTTVHIAGSGFTTHGGLSGGDAAVYFEFPGTTDPCAQVNVSDFNDGGIDGTIYTAYHPGDSNNCASVGGPVDLHVYLNDGTEAILYNAFTFS